ncbi:MAG: hypothetical protein ACRDHY_17205 [Anaerolineales bacterium]
MPVPGQRQVRPGQVVHGAYGLRKLLRRGGPAGRRQLKQIRDEHDRYLLAKGYPTWTSAPRPLQVLIEIAVELDLFRRALFAGFYRGLSVPARYSGILEMQRRVLVGLGVLGEPRVPNLEAILGTMMQEPAPPEETPPARSSEVEGAVE